MVTVKFFGTARLILKMKQEEFSAETVKDLLAKIAEKAGVPAKKMKQFLVFVNEENIDSSKGFRTELNDGDVVMVLSPSSGG